MAILSNFDNSSSEVSLEGYKLGDVESFASSDITLDETWLKCDGSAVDKSLYPEICQYLPKKSDVSTGWTSHPVNSNNEVYAEVSDMYCYKGTWVYLMDKYTSHTQSYKWPYICYTNDVTGTWTEVALSVDHSGCNLTGVCCYNGKWVVVGNYFYDSVYNVYAWYTDDITSNNWTRVLIDSNSAQLYIYDVHCHNGVWVGCGIYGSSTKTRDAIVWVTTDPAGTWTKTTIGDSGFDANGICYLNNTWVVRGYSNASTRGIIWYTSDPINGTWTSTMNMSMTNSIKSIEYYNGMWVVIGGSSSKNCNIRYTNNIASTSWTNVDITLSYTATPSDICYVDGKWVIIGSMGNNTKRSYIWYNDNVSNATGWTAIDLGDLTTSNSAYFVSDIYAYDGICCIAGTWENVSNYRRHIMYNINSYSILPNTSSTNPNTYVKAK